MTRLTQNPVNPEEALKHLEHIVDDLESLKMIAEDSELLMEAADIVSSDCNQRLTKIKQEIQHRDGEQLSQSAHAIKSAFGCFATTSALEVACKLEQMGKNKEFTDSEELFCQLSDEVARIHSLLAVLLCDNHPSDNRSPSNESDDSTGISVR